MFHHYVVQTVNRFFSLRTHRLREVPIVILMPHSACNCRCVMCDIWKGNSNRKQLALEDIEHLIKSFQKLKTRRVIMSGGEALLNPLFFEYCALLRQQKIRVTLLSTGLTLEKHAREISREIDEVIVSLDGDPVTHNIIRNVPGAFEKMFAGIKALRAISPSMRISGRTVIHRLNYKVWPEIVDTARRLSLDSISFLPADVTSTAFNRLQPWEQNRQNTVLVPKEELSDLSDILEKLLQQNAEDIELGFILESEKKLREIVQYYHAHHKLAPFPAKKCNAPWVSAVVEADGAVRPCFFHDNMGNIRQESLEKIINGKEQIAYRRNLKVSRNETCIKCVCSLNLSLTARVN